MEILRSIDGHLYPVDFEDTLWGYPVQDIAMAMQDLMSDVTSRSYTSHYSPPFVVDMRACCHGPKRMRVKWTPSAPGACCG